MDIVKMKFGSVLYGTNTPASDTDYKGIYLPTLEEILLKGPFSHKSESTKDNERAKNTADDVDTESYSLAYFVKMAIEGETVCIDILHANRESIITPQNWIWDYLIENRERFYSKNMKAFIGYVLRQTAKYGIKGSRLQAMEDVIAVLGAQVKNPLSVVWNKLPVNEYCTKEVRPGANDRQDNFYVVCGKMFLENTECWRVRESIQKMYDGYGARAQQAKENQGIDWKAVSHAMRACYQLRDIYLHGEFTYPLRDAAELKQVKAGELDYLSVVAPKLEVLVSEINELAAKSKYPEKVDKAWWDAWLLDVYSEAFNISLYEEVK